jgi:hypothetical protein
MLVAPDVLDEGGRETAPNPNPQGVGARAALYRSGAPG